MRTDGGFALAGARIIYRMRSQPLVIRRWEGLAELPGLPGLPKLEADIFSMSLSEMQKVLAFVIFSCYKMNGPLGSKTGFGATCNPALLKTSRKSLVFFKVTSFCGALAFRTLAFITPAFNP